MTPTNLPATHDSAPVADEQGLPFDMPIELGKVREFVVATRGDLELWIDGEHPTAPPTFLATARLWQDAGQTVNPQTTDTSRLLHAGQRYLFHGAPPKVGDRLVGQARISARYTKEGRRGGLMSFTEVSTDFHDTDGRLVATSVTTTVITELAPEDDR